MRYIPLALLITVATPVLAAPVDNRAAVAIAAPQTLIVDKSLPPAAVAALLKPVDAFYGFWNNASQRLLDQAISPHFIDRALPAGRPQGPMGLMIAGRAFLRAVPDLRVTIPQRLVVGDRVVSHLHFTGHFTGKGAKAAASQSISSQPTTCGCGMARSPTAGTWRTISPLCPPHAVRG